MMNHKTMWAGLWMLAVLLCAAPDAHAQWRSVPYDAANFTALSPMTWTVDAGDVSAYRYTINDRTMTLAVIVENTSVSGTASQLLRIRIPDGYKGGGRAFNPAFVIRDSGSPREEVVWAVTNKNDPWVHLFRPNAAVHQLSSSQTHVYLTITFDVCGEDPGNCP